MLESVLITMQKKRPQQIPGICETFKNTFFYRTPSVVERLKGSTKRKGKGILKGKRWPLTC